MFKVNFCYVISEKVGMAHTADRENAQAYIKASIDIEKDLTGDEYKKAHEGIMLKNISNSLDIDDEMLKPITYAEYLDNADDE